MVRLSSNPLALSVGTQLPAPLCALGPIMGALIFEVMHDGYRRLPSPAEHRRTFSLLGLLLDNARQSKQLGPSYDLHFHFTPGTNPVIEMADRVAAVRELSRDLPAWRCLRLRYSRMAQGSWMGFDVLRRARLRSCLTFAAHGEGAREFVTFLFAACGAS